MEKSIKSHYKCSIGLGAWFKYDDGKEIPYMISVAPLLLAKESLTLASEKTFLNELMHAINIIYILVYIIFIYYLFNYIMFTIYNFNI